MALYKKGQSGNPNGRPKGSPNKTTIAAKDALQMAFEGVGGVPALIEWAKNEKNQGAFFNLYTKLLPIQVTGEGGGAVEINITSKQSEII